MGGYSSLEYNMLLGKVSSDEGELNKLRHNEEYKALFKKGSDGNWTLKPYEDLSPAAKKTLPNKVRNLYPDNYLADIEAKSRKGKIPNWDDNQ